MDSNALLDAALACAQRGWSIIPIRHKPGTDGKQPAVKTWKRYETERPTDDELRAMFNGRRVDGLAVIFGAVSGGLVCRDFDDMRAYERWSAEYPDLAASLPTVKTGRGRHVYFVADVDRIIKLPGGELRGAGYCLLPPSVHPSGALYTWLVPLPDGPLPTIDPFGCGLAARENGLTERTERTENTEKTEKTECPESPENDKQSNGSALSAISVNVDPADPAIAAAIRATVPKSVGQRNGAIFELARALKGLPALADADAGSLCPLVKEWHRQALPVIGTKEFDDTWGDFLYAWPNVCFPLGIDPLALTLKLADLSEPPPCAGRYESEATRRLVKLARELQRAVGDRAFFLSSRTVAALLGMDHTTAWKRLRMLEADRVLQVVQRGDTRRATRYRYTGGD